jgi:hypothetical protein
MIDELFNPGKLLSLLKNKYGGFVLQKSINYLTKEEREEMSLFIQTKVNVTSQKEKTRINTFLQFLSTNSL